MPSTFLALDSTGNIGILHNTTPSLVPRHSIHCPFLLSRHSLSAPCFYERSRQMQFLTQAGPSCSVASDRRVSTTAVVYPSVQISALFRIINLFISNSQQRVGTIRQGFGLLDYFFFMFAFFNLRHSVLCCVQPTPSQASWLLRLITKNHSPNRNRRKDRQHKKLSDNSER